MNSKYCYRVALLAIAAVAAAVVATITAPMPAFAQGFSAGVSPARFELRAKPGAVVRETLTIMNADAKAADYLLRTIEWELTDLQGIDFIDDRLLDDSCRPWVRLERRNVRVRARGEKKYRFEVNVPEDAVAGLCKFALVIEPGESAKPTMVGNQQISFPVVGRYAVIVYVTVGDAAADIEYLGLGERQVGNLRLPTLRLHNNGNTYDRTFGEIRATGADGKRYLLVASTFPVLPDRTEEILLSPETGDSGQQNDVQFSYPLRLKGKFEIGGKSFAIEEDFN